MNHFSSLIAAELEENLLADTPVLSTLDGLIAELCACDSEARPAMIIAKAFEKAGKAPELAKWLAERTGCLETPSGSLGDLDEARRRLRISNTVFDLTGLLIFEAADREKVVASLLKVWSYHVDWRKWASAVGRATGMQAWLDPATIADTSPLMLNQKSQRKVKRHLAEVDAMGDDYHPLMRDYCYYLHLRQIAERCCPPDGIVAIGHEQWPDVAGFATARIVKRWLESNPFFLTFACHQLKAGVDEATWPTVAERVYEHCRPKLSGDEREELAELLGHPRCKPPSLERLADQAAGRVSMSLTPLRRHAGGWR